MTFVLLNTMRITFTNSTQTTLSNIHIHGCGSGYIEKLDIGQRKTVWIDITGDCSINIDYLFKGQTKKEIIADYVTTFMGQKINYKIRQENEEYFR
jgi:hypothetical protein